MIAKVEWTLSTSQQNKGLTQTHTHTHWELQ